jgi:hypothetical protein
MATTATISISSDIAPGFGGISNTMTLTKAGALTDIEETIGFSRRKLAATTAVDIIRMATELVDTTATTTAAKVYVRNMGDGKGSFDKSTYVKISIGASDGTMQEIGKLYGGDWMLFPVTAADDMDVVAAPENNNAVVLEYTMFYE